LKIQAIVHKQNIVPQKTRAMQSSNFNYINKDSGRKIKKKAPGSLCLVVAVFLHLIHMMNRDFNTNSINKKPAVHF
jgi:hypothetical protein